MWGVFKTSGKALATSGFWDDQLVCKRDSGRVGMGFVGGRKEGG